METKFNFKSQICTTREQSERLIALGLKKETADMAIEPDLESTYEVYYISAYPPSKRGILAWSLHRLIEMCDVVIRLFEKKAPLYSGKDSSAEETLYDNLIDCIEWLIKEGYFNKEYLNGND